MRQEPMSQLHAGHVGKKTCVRVVWMGRLEREVEIISIYNGWMDRYFICLSIAQNLIVKKNNPGNTICLKGCLPLWSYEGVS